MTIRIGIPKETCANEKRMILAPTEAKELIGKGYQILIEHEAYCQANFTQHDYPADINWLASNKEIYQNANIILKIQPPSLEEIEYCHEGTVIISFIFLISTRIAPKNERKSHFKP